MPARDSAAMEDSQRARRRVVVTGGSGFIGSHLARALAEGGHDVVVFGRNRYAAPRTFHPRISFRRGDLRDAAAVDAAVTGADVVFHAGALSSPWGRRADFFAVNVEGTRHVVDACTRHAVKRLVHVSSTSVFFENRDRTRLPDDAPFASPFCNDYAESKAQAERVVRAAVDGGLDAVIVRARAVIGPGDAAIVPRVLAAAGRGRLRQIGEGDNELDVTYVDNLVDALILAMDRAPKGAAFTVTNDEPVRIWPLLREACALADIAPPAKKISHAKLDVVARVLEAVFARLPGRPEPPVTRYGVGLLATTQTFDVGTAKRELGWAPRVTVKDGLARTVRHLREKNDEHADTAVKLSFLFTGYCTNWQHHVLAGAEKKRVPFHSMVALIEHPRFGVTLVDAGYARHFHDETRRFPFSIYARITPVTTHDHESAAAQLRARGIAPADVARVLVTHFHGDHIAGLRDFENADVVCAREAWRSVAGRGAIGAVRRGHVPGLLPDDVEKRLYTIDRFDDAGIGPFERTHDLFGDGSVRLVPLPGHARGQFGVLVQSGPRERKLLVADAAWTTSSWRDRIMPHPITRFITASAKQYAETIDRIRAFAARYPDVEIVPTHCPEVYARHGRTAGLLGAGESVDEASRGAAA